MIAATSAGDRRTAPEPEPCFPPPNITADACSDAKTQHAEQLYCRFVSGVAGYANQTFPATPSHCHLTMPARHCAAVPPCHHATMPTPQHRARESHLHRKLVRSVPANHSCNRLCAPTTANSQGSRDAPPSTRHRGHAGIARPGTRSVQHTTTCKDMKLRHAGRLAMQGPWASLYTAPSAPAKRAWPIRLEGSTRCAATTAATSSSGNRVNIMRSRSTSASLDRSKNW
jgi:hypothetical protein